MICGWERREATSTRISQIDRIRLDQDGEKPDRNPGSNPHPRTRNNLGKLQKIGNDVLSNFPNAGQTIFAPERSPKNRRFVRANQTDRIFRFSETLPKNPEKSPEIGNDDRRSLESIDVESNGRIVKSPGYRSTCTGARNGKRNGSTDESANNQILIRTRTDCVRAHAIRGKNKIQLDSLDRTR